MNEPQQYGQQQYGAPRAPDPWDLANGGGKSLTWAITDQFGQKQSVPVGTEYVGTVCSLPETVQQRDYDTGQPKFYDDGNPMWNIRFGLQTQLRDDEQDDGVRMVFLRSQSLRALQDEMKRLGIKSFGLGTVFQQKLVGLKPSGKGSPQKLYEIRLNPTAPSNPAVDAVLTGQGYGQAPAQPQGWAPAQGQFPQQVPQQPVYQQPMAPQPQQPVYQQPAAPQQPVYQQPMAPQPPVPQQFPPQPPAGPAAALAAGYTEVQQQAPVQAPPVSQAPPMQPSGASPDDVRAVQMLMSRNIARQEAIAAVANGNQALFSALDSEVPF